MAKRLIFLALCCLPLCQLSGTGWYTENWDRLAFPIWEKGLWSFSSLTEIRSQNHCKNMRWFQQSALFAYQATENFRTEIHYTYIHGRSVVADSLWEWQHRLELEANWTFPLPCGTSLKTRNRVEFRKFQDNPKIQYRLRHMSQFIFPVKGCGRIKSFGIHNEIFYDASTHLFNQDRFYPAVLTLALSDKSTLDLFCLLHFFLHADLWRHSLIFGTQLSF